MFFEGAEEEFCSKVIKHLRLNSWHQTLLLQRYAEHKSDKEIANEFNVCKDHINKEIAKSLELAYDALKVIQQQVWCSNDKS